VADLVVGVVRHVLIHVFVEDAERGQVSGTGRVDSGQLVVLLPEIRLENLRGRQKPENRDVAFREGAPGAGILAIGGRRLSRQEVSSGGGGSHRKAPLQEPAPIDIRWLRAEQAHDMVLR
jgi:hypothetical protein